MSSTAVSCIRVLCFLGIALACGSVNGAEAQVEPSKASRSENPTEEAIRSVRLFSEPLVPIGKPTPVENRDLARALRSFEQRANADDFSALEEFVAKNPGSAWMPALRFNLGMEYFKTGWYSKTLAAWEKIWPLLKSANEAGLKALGDRAAGELAYMYGRLGRMTELAALLRDVEGRAFMGPATEKITGAREGLWTMQNRPEVGFRCGPFALDRILAAQKSTNVGCALIHGSKSSTNGFSLSEVATLSRKLGMNYQMAYRSPGATFIYPAVVNWKVGHYAAMVKEVGGLYLLQDPTFGNDTWVSPRALEAETSGFFLVPPGELPAGWRTVSEAEGDRVFGKGSTSNKDNNSNTCDDPSSCPSCQPPGEQSYPYAGIRGMAKANVHLMLVSLNIRDTPVGYSPPVGPGVATTVTYNQREANQPGSFNYVNLGPKWTFNWLAYLVDTPSTPAADVNYFTDSGGTLPFSGYNTTNQTFLPQIKNQAMLKRTSTNSYDMVFKNGYKYVFSLPDCTNCTTRHVFMTQIVDPQGNAVQINYDTNYRVASVTDAIGQATTFSYTYTNDTRRLTKVTDPFGRFATFLYDASGRLTNITDVIGMNSQFTYDGGDFIQAMTTPYGTTSFEKGENGPQRWLITTFPNGEKERVEFFESAYIGVPAIESVYPAGMNVANEYLIYRNSFHWDRKQYAEGAGDYTKAHLYHWLHFATGIAAGVLESEKEPLDKRIWYSYDGQGIAYNYGTTDQPNAIGRVLDDGTTQLIKLAYDSSGNVTNITDPLGRSQRMVYSTNGIDLLEVRQTTGGASDLLVQYVYNSQHLPIAIQDVAGQWTSNTYNARGQLISTRNPKGEIVSFTYDPNGYLISADGPLPGGADTVMLTYDTVGRVRTFTDVDGYTVTNSYDNLERLTNIVHPDATFAAFTYDKLDRVKVRDRQGREVNFTYDALRQLTSVKDPLNRMLRFEYCDCGGVSALIDPLGRVTRWEHDLQGRMTAKRFADGSRSTYNYDSASRLKSVHDEKGQIRSYEYLVDGALKRISHPAAEIGTPSMNFAYDAVYGRLLSMQDGVGVTTWTYVPASSLGALNVASVDGPWANDTIAYQYDALGRATNRAINGVAQSLAFDPAGRTTNILNVLGSFGFAFDSATPRLVDTVYPNGQTTHYDYFGGSADRRLQRITNRKPDTSVISRFNYAPDGNGTITNWTQELGLVTNQWGVTYDNANRLLNVAVTQGASNFNYSYTYDPAGNRSSETIASSNRTFQYNALNQLVSSSDTTVTNVTYEWDAEDQLVAVNVGTARTEFAYDGLGRRCRILEKTNGVVQSERRYVWCGLDLCEERDASDAVRQRFFDLGFTSEGANYFYTFDHLSSVHEVTDNAGQVQSRYAYAPFGARTIMLENVASPFGFAGHFRHANSGLSLAYLRQYDSTLGRWLSRDPMGEEAGFNLYAYVGNNPLNMIDPYGGCGVEFGKLWDAAKDFAAGTGYLGGLWGMGTYKATQYGIQGYLLLSPRGPTIVKEAVVEKFKWTKDFVKALWEARKSPEALKTAQGMYGEWAKDYIKDEFKDEAFDKIMEHLADKSVENYRDVGKSLGEFGNSVKDYFDQPKGEDCDCK